MPTPPKLELTVQPLWARQPKEAKMAYEHFTRYLNMPPITRSAANYAKEIGASVGGMNVLAYRNGWATRVRAYDDHVHAKIIDARERGIEKATERHARLSVMSLDKFEKWLLTLNDKKIEQLKAQDAIALFKHAMMGERLALGMSTENVASKQDTTIRIEYVNDWRGTPALQEPQERPALPPADATEGSYAEIAGAMAQAEAPDSEDAA